MSLTGAYGAHAVLCTAGSEAAYGQALRILRRRGTLVCIGLPPRLEFRLPTGPMDLVIRGLTVVGSSVGTEVEMQELLQMAVEKHVVPVIKIYELGQFDRALGMVTSSDLEGRVVLKIP